MIASPTGRQLGALAIGFAVGAFCVSSVGLAAMLFGWRIEPSGYALLFGLTASSIPMCAGLLTFKSWIENIQLDTYERRIRLQREYAEQATLTLDESDPLEEVDERAEARTQAIRLGLINFLLWASAMRGRLTSPAHIGQSVNNADDWEYWAGLLVYNGWAIKVNGVPTDWHPKWNPGLALLAAQTGNFLTPPGEAMPPPVAPCPNAWITLDEVPSAKGKGQKGRERSESYP